MAQPLSMDLRSRLLAAVDGGMSIRAAASRFGVAPSTAIRWQAQRRETGDIAPKLQGRGGTPGALVSLLPFALLALDAQGLHISLNVIERTDGVLNDLLRNGDIELAFVTTAIEEPPSDLLEATFSRNPFTLLVGRAHDGLPEAQGAFPRQVDALFIAAGCGHRATWCCAIRF